MSKSNTTMSENNDSSNRGNGPFQLQQSGYAVPLNGYIVPLLVVFTLVTNVLVCAVLLRKNMRSATNTLLVAMAISDMMTGVWPVPCYVYFFVGGYYIEWVPQSWCFIYVCLTEFLPTISHTASIWLTVALAIQRYMLVCHSLDARRWCSISNTVRACVVIYGVAIISQLSRFFETTYKPVVLKSRLNESQEVVGCEMGPTPFVELFEDVYFSLYYVFRIVFIHLIPCITLVILNALLVQTMRRASVRRAQLLKMNRKSECRRLTESNGTTLMLVVVVGVFLLVEFPMALLFIVYVAESMAGIELLDIPAATAANVFVNLCILLSYPVNFFIYCGMSQQFRSTFKSLFHSDKVTSSSCLPHGGGKGGGGEGAAGRVQAMQYSTMTSVCLMTTSRNVDDDDDDINEATEAVALEKIMKTSMTSLT